MEAVKIFEKAKWISPETVTEPDKRKGAGYLRTTFSLKRVKLAYMLRPMACMKY